MIRILVSVLRARVRGGLLRLRRVDRPLRLECLGEKCARCCQYLGGDLHLEPSERSVLEKHAPIAVERQSLLIRSPQHSCQFLSTGVCTIYDDRPRVCRDYPFYQIAGELYFDKGCPGIIEGEGRPDPAGLVPFSRMLEVFPRFSRRLIISVLTRW